MRCNDVICCPGVKRQLYSVYPHVVFFHPRFLGYIDKIGVAYNDPIIASGYGAYIAAVSKSCD